MWVLVLLERFRFGSIPITVLKTTTENNDLQTIYKLKYQWTGSQI